MKNRSVYIFLLLLIVGTIFVPIKVNATNEQVNGNTEEVVPIPCEGSEDAVLGDVNDEKSVAWLIQKIFNYVKILGPTIAIVLSSLDFAKAIVTSDDDTMKKAQSKFIKRMIAAALLFFIPLITQVLLGLFGLTTDNPTCGLK